MSHSDFKILASSLRKIMKTKKVRYADLATKMNVSEATIKRFFTGRDGSVSRISEICTVLSISFSDLVAHAHKENEPTFILTFDQEKFFASHPEYFSFFLELVEKQLSPHDIRLKYNISKHSVIRYLRQLEKMNLLDWLTSDRVSLKVRGTLNWRERGPLQKKFLSAENLLFLKYSEENLGLADHFMTTSSRYIHRETLNSFISELKPLFNTYRKRAYRDEVFYPLEQLVSIKWLMAISPFEPIHSGKVIDL